MRGYLAAAICEKALGDILGQIEEKFLQASTLPIRIQIYL